MELYEEPIAVLTMLTRVAKINGVIDEPERRLIESMAEKMMVPQDMVDAIIEGRVTAEINPPDVEWERIPYFQMCVMMTGVNGEFDEREAVFCKRLGHKLGLRSLVLDRVMALFKEHFPEPVPIEELRKAYQIGHN
jgi:hypothetical protein